MLLVFGFFLLNQTCRALNITEKEDPLVDMLDPYLELIRNCIFGSAIQNHQQAKSLSQALKKKQSALSSALIDIGLKCSQILLRFPLPSRGEYASDLSNFCFTLLQSGQKDILSSAFKTIAVLIRCCHSFFTMTTPQYELLLTHIQQDMISPQQQSVAFSLLRAILSVKVNLPIIYDLMDKVSELLVTSQIVEVQKSCQYCLISFLLDYPLGSKRWQQHLGFLLNQLNYNLRQGRERVLEVLEQICIRFPTSELDRVVEINQLCDDF